MAAASASLANEAAQRYASALFELAQENAALETVARDFSDFGKLLRENKDLARLIASPAFGREEKTKALVEVATEAGVSDLLRKFFGAMASNGRARDIPAAQNAFDALYAKQRGVKRAMARTAKPMSDSQRDRIRGILAKAVGGDVDLSEEVDPNLIGGIQLRIGSQLVDASISTKLDRMNTAMKGA
ncbi:MAG: F0F1 ATP synthase subunit delta [Pseudomonadota bacterium]